MNREQAKQNLVGFGIAEPTEEQISAYLDQVNGETRRERERAERFKTDAAKVSDLQKQLDDINAANMTDLEKANTERDNALKSVSELQQKVQRMETLNVLASMGIVGDDAKNLIKDDGSLDFETLGKIITDRETAAAAAKEKALLDGTKNPGGSGGSDETKSSAVQIAETLFPKSNRGQDNAILKQYINGGI